MAGTKDIELRPDILANAPVGRLTGLRCTAGQGTKLVFVHGSGTRLRAYTQLLNEFLKVGEQDVYVFRFNSQRGSASRVAGSLKDALQELLRQEEARLILVGHSLGGVLIRRAVLDLYADDPAVLDRIIRLVLLSTTNRGFEPVKLSQGVLRRLANLVGYHAPILDGLRGSTWMTRLRIDWLETFGGVRIRPRFDKASDGDVVTRVPDGEVIPAHPVTIQIDGDRDRVVRPDDSADLEMFADAVTHLRVEGIGHFDFALSGLLPGADGRAPAEWSQARELTIDTKRRSLERLAGEIRAAVVGGRDPVGPPRPPGPGFGLALDPPGGGAVGGNSERVAGTPAGWFGAGGEPARLNIIFMIHGIRDYGGWHAPLGESLEARLDDPDVAGFWRIVAVEYGYFSALQFLLPAQQSRVVHGFVDRYLNEMTRAFGLMLRLGRFLPVQVHIAAHSNGSNILAQAIERDAELSFTRVFLAGCVLRRDFWSRHPDRAFSVRNDCATNDWPVGVLCRCLGQLPTLGYWFLGTAGVDGFSGPVVGQAVEAERAFVRNSRWLTGDHGAAIELARIDTVADYLIKASPPEAPVNADRPSSMRGEWLAFGSLSLSLAAVAVALGAGLFALGGLKGVGLGLALTLLAVALVYFMLNF